MGKKADWQIGHMNLFIFLPSTSLERQQKEGEKEGEKEESINKDKKHRMEKTYLERFKWILESGWGGDE